MLRLQALIQVHSDEEWLGDEAIDGLRAELESDIRMLFEVGCLRDVELNDDDVVSVTLVEVPDEDIVARRNEHNVLELWVNGQSVTVRPSQLHRLMAALRAEAE